MQRRVTSFLVNVLLVTYVTSLPAPSWTTAGRRAVGAGPAKDSPAMYPFMTLKPYLPVKPVNPFTPAFVPDPKTFIDKKTELLNNIFTSPAMMGGAADAAADGPPSPGKPWSVGPGGPWAPAPIKRALGPVGPMGPWAGAASPWMPTAATTVDPTVIMGKKADFLSKLFAGLETPASPGTPGGMSIVPPGFWMPLPPLPPTTTPAPTVDDMKAKILSQLLQAVDTAPEPVTSTPPILLAPTPAAAKMIVPPSYWIPTDTTVMGPGAYMKKVSDYLDKLFASMNTTTATPAEVPSTRSLMTEGGKVARHHDDWRPQDWQRAVTTLSSIAAANPPPPSGAAALTAKDLVVNSILSEVGELKTAMLDTLNEMLLKQKEASAATTKKPMKFGPFPWGPTPKPTPDPTEPYQKRLDTIGQVFDMLTTLGQEVTSGSPPASPGASPSNSTVTRTSRSVVAPLRSVQMAVHQGYQSMPAGTEEVVSAGAGRDPTSAHEGGGLNLKIKIPQ